MNHEQLTLINPIDLGPGHSAGATSNPYDPSWTKPDPRTAPVEGNYIPRTTPEAQADTLQVGDTVEILPFTDQWNIQRGHFEKAIITAIDGDRITLSIPGIVTRDGYQCDRSRIKRLQ